VTSDRMSIVGRRYAPMLWPRAARAVVWVALIMTMMSTSGGDTRAHEPIQDETDASMTLTDVTRYIAEAPIIREVALSPDGQVLIYSVSRGSVRENNWESELLLQRLDREGNPDGPPHELASVVSDKVTTFSPKWRPDGRSVAYFATLSNDDASGAGFPAAQSHDADKKSASALVRYDLASGKAVAIPLDDRPRPLVQANAADSRPKIRAIPSNYEWSPSGRFIAFMSQSEASPRLDPRTGVLANTNQSTPGLPAARSGLFTLDVSTGIVTQLPLQRLHVLAFDWAPDEHALVVAASPTTEGVTIRRTDLFIARRDTGEVVDLVKQPGQDMFPSWSTDGRSIAFSSHFGDPVYQSGWLAVVPARGGPVTRVGMPDDPAVSLPGKWFPDGKTYAYIAAHQLAWRLVVADLEKRQTTVVGSDMTNVDAVSFSADRRRCAIVRSTVNSPPEIFVQDWPSGVARQITKYASAFPLAPRVRLDRVSWPSSDGRFEIHGLLLTPRLAWTNERAARPQRPLPAVLFHYGGPSMVSSSFSSGISQGGILAFAVRGYAVLAVNSRGRGGYGDAFRQSIRDDQSVGRLQHADAMAGLDVLVTRGIADPDRLAVHGHSYGGYLSAYDITQTNRFRAAVVHEGVGADRLTAAVGYTSSDSDWALLVRDLAGAGIRDPFERSEQERLIAESPLFNVGRVKTPTLLQFGTNSGANTEGRKLFGALQRAGVPSELQVYDEGHVFARPSARADSMARMGAWLDYWVRDMPYPDPALGSSYDAWRSSQRVTRTER
jgi:dipeptidyl aminopeptidase/acylaminoacyl peptidase